MRKQTRAHNHEPKSRTSMTYKEQGRAQLMLQWSTSTKKSTVTSTKSTEISFPISLKEPTAMKNHPAMIFFFNFCKKWKHVGTACTKSTFLLKLSNRLLQSILPTAPRPADRAAGASQSPSKEYRLVNKIFWCSENHLLQCVFATTSLHESLVPRAELLGRTAASSRYWQSNSQTTQKHTEVSPKKKKRLKMYLIFFQIAAERTKEKSIQIALWNSEVYFLTFHH